MKKLLFSALVMALTANCFAQAPAKKAADVAKFTNETIDFGKIKQSVPAKGTFTVTNISSAPLIIEQANPTCGCTISDYTKEPIAPGKTGVINATYNAANAGHFEKHITVKYAGIEDIKSITFTGDVIPAADFDKAAAEAKAAPVVAPAAAKAAAPVKATKATKTVAKAKATK